jgi:HlyD family secretion protein
VRAFLAVCVVIFVLLASVLVIAGPKVGSWMSFETSQGGTEVRLQDVKPGELIETVSAPGEISPFAKVNISAEVSARILELPFRDGDSVKEGDIVVRLDDREYRAQLESSKARRDSQRYRLRAEQSRLAGPESSLENARATLARQESLMKTGDVSRQTLEDAQARVRDWEAQVASSKHNISVLESEIAAAEADIERVQKAVDKCIIKAPMSGKVTVLNAEVGELVVVGTMNNAGTVILTIGDLSRIKLDAKVSEADIARVTRDQRAVVRINAFKDDTFEGRVIKVPLARTDQLGGGASGTSGYFKVEIEVTPHEGQQLLSGLAANVDIEIATHRGLTLPSQAILEKPTEELPATIRDSSPLVDRSRRSTSVVFRQVDGKAEITPVKIGPSNLTDTIVVAGLQEGDVVITGPYKSLEKLKTGDRVKDEKKKSEDAANDTPAEAVAAKAASN